MKKLFFAIILFQFFYTETSIELCLERQCNQIIPYFYFTNKNDNRIVFKQVEQISAHNQPFIDSLSQFMNQLSIKINTGKKQFIESIKSYFSRNQKEATAKEMMIKTYVNTVLIIKELFHQEAPLVHAVFYQIKLIHPQELLITKIINEIMEILAQKIKADDFSLIPIEKKSILSKLKSSQNKYLFSTIKHLNFLFFKINTLIYWNYILEIVFKNDADKNQTYYYSDAKTQNFRNETLSGIFVRISQRLSDQLDEIIKLKGPLDSVSPKTVMENNAIDQIIEWIRFNMIIINSLAGTKNCNCPYLQTNFIFKPLNISLKIEDNDEYISTINNHINKRAEEIIDSPETISSDIIDEFISLYRFCEILIPRIKFQNTTKTTFTKSIEKKMQLFDQKIDSIASKISRFWINQLKKESMKLSLWQKMTHYFYNKYRRKNYFFGFSLLSYSNKSPTINRYTYMISQLEEIFTLINQLIQYKTIQPFHVNQKLDELVKILKQYQEHFFMNRSNESLLQNTVLLPKKFQKEMLFELAKNEQDPHTLQVGIEYVIIDRIIGWIGQNQEIIKKSNYQASKII